jgi:RNA polymerase sigma factor (sigma-70 family)
VRTGRTSTASVALPDWKLRRAAVLRSGATRGDAAAFTALYERHHQALYRYCRSILHHDEDAHDALQSTMAKAFAALQHEERDFDLRPWLFRIAHNEAISLLRRRRDALPLDTAQPVGRDSLPGTVETRERLARLREDLVDLPERQRAALVLRELSGLGHDEIATVLDSSPRAVKQTIFEARTSLGECDEGRAMACADIQRMLSDADGRVLRGRRVRAHLRSCRSCRQFKAALAQRPSDLALLAPPLPAAAGAALLTAIAGGGAATAGGGAAGAGAGAGGTALASKIVAIVTATAAAAGGTVAATKVVGDHGSPARSSHQSERAPRHATGSAGRSSALTGGTGLSLSVRAGRPGAGRGTLDRPARRTPHPAAGKRPPGAASSPSHGARPERAREERRPDQSAPPAAEPVKQPKPVKAKTPKPVKVKAPERRAVGQTRPQPPKSQGKANGHEKEPKGPKTEKAPKPATPKPEKAPKPATPKPETPKPEKAPKPATPEMPSPANNGKGNGQK